MNEFVKKITKKVLDVCPDINIKKDDYYEFIIEPKNDNGFGIYLQIDERENTIHFDSFHFHFDNNDKGNKELMSFIGYALSNRSRLKVYSKGHKEFKWKFEVQDVGDKNWISYGSMAILYFNPFKKTKVSYRHNEWLDMDELNP